MEEASSFAKTNSSVELKAVPAWVGLSLPAKVREGFTML